MSEVWKSIPGFEGLYDVSDLGRIRSLPRMVPSSRGPRMSPGKILKFGFPGVKYYAVWLYRNGIGTTMTVHRAVLLAFVGLPQPGQEGCHFNGDPHDNRLLNLRWDSRSANRADSIRIGTIPRGEDRATSKLSFDEVFDILLVVKLGISRTAVGLLFDVSPMTIGKIVRRLGL